MRSSKRQAVILFIVTVMLVIVAVEATASAAEPGPSTSEDAAWQALEGRYQGRLREIDANGASERTARAAQADALRATLAAKQSELAALQATIARREHLVSRLSTRRFLGVSGSIAFCVLLVHLLILLFRTPNPPIPFRTALCAAVAILLLFVLPAFAAENLDQDLVTANRLVSASPAERGLSWLTRLEGRGTLPAEIAVTDYLLTPYRELQRGSAEYYFTRAALLWEIHEREAAFGALRDLVTAAPQANPAELYARVLQFLARENTAMLPETAAALLPRIKDRSALTALALEFAKTGQDALAKKAAEAIGAGTSGTADLVTTLSTFYDTGHRELTVPLVSAAVAKASNPGDLVTLVGMELQHADRPVAISVIEQGIGRFGPAVADSAIEDPALLYPKDELPGDSEISLAVLLGILNEKEGLTAGAKPAYEHAAASELERVLATGAFEFSARLRSLFYVERFWREQGEEHRLPLLRPVYERVQDATLAAVRELQQAEDRTAAEKISGENATLEAQIASVEHELVAARASLRRLNVLLPLRIARLLAIATALMLIALGCVRVARPTASAQRTSMAWGFAEASGWVLVFSVVGASIGLPLVLLARLGTRGVFTS